MDDCVAGLSFADTADAKAFYQAVTSVSISPSLPPSPSCCLSSQLSPTSASLFGFLSIICCYFIPIVIFLMRPSVQMPPHPAPNPIPSPPHPPPSNTPNPIPPLPSHSLQPTHNQPLQIILLLPLLLPTQVQVSSSNLRRLVASLPSILASLVLTASLPSISLLPPSPFLSFPFLFSPLLSSFPLSRLLCYSGSTSAPPPAAAAKKKAGIFSKLKSHFASSDVPEDFVVSDPRGFRHGMLGVNIEKEKG